MSRIMQDYSLDLRLLQFTLIELGFNLTGPSFRI
jgi:hypothetical protein